MIASKEASTTWGLLTRQVDKIVGASAPEDMLSALEALASAHHAQVRWCVCSYSFSGNSHNGVALLPACSSGSPIRARRRYSCSTTRLAPLQSATE